jgi:hypothetical protein
MLSYTEFSRTLRLRSRNTKSGLATRTHVVSDHQNVHYAAIQKRKASKANILEASSALKRLKKTGTKRIGFTDHRVTVHPLHLVV